MMCKRKKIDKRTSKSSTLQNHEKSEKASYILEENIHDVLSDIILVYRINKAHS